MWQKNIVMYFFITFPYEWWVLDQIDSKNAKLRTIQVTFRVVKFRKEWLNPWRCARNNNYLLFKRGDVMNKIILVRRCMFKRNTRKSFLKPFDIWICSEGISASSIGHPSLSVDWFRTKCRESYQCWLNCASLRSHDEKLWRERFRRTISCSFTWNTQSLTESLIQTSMASHLGRYFFGKI